MFYKFNSMIGRIAPSTQAEAYSPQGLRPVTQKPSVFIFDSQKTKAVHEPAVTARPAATAAAHGGAMPETAASGQGLGLGVVPASPGYRRIMDMQNTFLKEDGRLVWQKLGRDRMSYFATLAVMAVGTVFSVSVLYKMSFPQKTED